MDKEIRTDLALEEKERFEQTDVEIQGVVLEEEKSLGGIFKTTKVRIINESGAEKMRKPMGNYITLENCLIEEYDESLQEEIAGAVAKELREIQEDLKKRGRLSESGKVLVVGLGNRDATPDALGPVTISDVFVGESVYAVAPGVMAQTGVETAAFIKGLVKEIKADLIIAIDALAARNTKRLNTTIQISDSGIQPGSGVGNHRQAINEESMGIPVIAIGVPTVVDAATIVNDVMDNLVGALSQLPACRGLLEVMEEFSREEKRQLVKELMEKEERDLYVTSKDIDEDIRILGHIISRGLNEALF